MDRALKRPSSITVWWLASRPKTLNASLVPVMVGLALSYHLQGVFNLISAIATLAMAVSIQIGINLFNDALDFKKGVDTADRIGFARATQMGWLKVEQVLMGGSLAFGFALLCAIYLSNAVGWEILGVASICIIGGYLYSGGPYPLATLGLSDPAVLFFFGFIASATTCYIQLSYIPKESLIVALQIGLLATALSAINNLRDVKQDRLAGRKTLPVRFGLTFARIEIALALLLPFTIGSYWWFSDRPLATLLPCIAFPLAASVVYSVIKTDPSPLYNGFLAKAAMVLLSFGIALSSAFLLS